MTKLTDIDEVKKHEVKPSVFFTVEDKETVICIDDNGAVIYSNIGTHIRSILRKNCIELIEAEEEDNCIISVRVRIPLNYLKVCIRKKGRTVTNLSNVFN